MSISPKLRMLAIVACASALFACKQDGASTTTTAPAAGGTAAAASDMGDDAHKFGYAVGVELGNSLTPVVSRTDIDSLKKGLDDALAANKKIEEAKKDLEAKRAAFVAKGGSEAAANDDPDVKKAADALADAEKKPGVKMDEAARDEIKTTVAKSMREEQEKLRTAQAAKAKEDGEKFLAENGKRAGVKTTASGLQYEVEKEGEGKNPTEADEVTVNYRGTLITGEEFDSSYSRNQPVTFPLANVIKGWTEGVQLMKPGAKYKFYIPSELAYGERGAGAKIGPNSTLVFEVELLSIGKPAADAAGDEPAEKASDKPVDGGPAGGKPAAEKPVAKPAKGK